MTQIPSPASSYPTALDQVMQPPDFGPAPQKPIFLEIHEKASLSFIVKIRIVYSFFQSFDENFKHNSQPITSSFCCQ